MENKIVEILKYIFTFKWMSKKFWIRLFLSQISTIIILKILGYEYISDTLVLGVMGFITALLGLYTYNKKNES
jgi:hypothetical protein